MTRSLELTFSELTESWTGFVVLVLESSRSGCWFVASVVLIRSRLFLLQLVPSASTTYDLGASVTLVTTAGVHVFCPGFLTHTVSPVFRGFKTFAFRFD